MKILEQRSWPGTTIQCPKCKNKLLVESQDVKFSLTQNAFCCDCVCCNEQIILDRLRIPKNVQIAVLMDLKQNNLSS